MIKKTDAEMLHYWQQRCLLAEKILSCVPIDVVSNVYLPGFKEALKEWEGKKEENPAYHTNG